MLVWGGIELNHRGHHDNNRRRGQSDPEDSQSVSPNQKTDRGTAEQIAYLLSLLSIIKAWRGWATVP